MSTNEVRPVLYKHRKKDSPTVALRKARLVRRAALLETKLARFNAVVQANDPQHPGVTWMDIHPQYSYFPVPKGWAGCSLDTVWAPRRRHCLGRNLRLLMLDYGIPALAAPR